jgi:alpha-D-ribose 1-methylphosphonate 5-triphosphate diphosphatase PhnM
VQRRSKSGKMVTYTITRLDRDARSRRVFIATCDDLDVEVVFSEEEMRVMVAEKQVTLPPSDDSSSISEED